MTRVQEKYSILVAAVVLVVAALLLHDTSKVPIETSADYIGYALRVTAWITFLFFISAYVAGPLRTLFGGSNVLVRNRRYLGLAAAFSHTVHFGYVVSYARLTGSEVDLITWVFGGMAFVLFWLMALTSNNWSVRKLGHWWQRLHLFGMHYIWFIFLVTFLGGVGSNWISTVFFLDAVAALGLRVAATWKKRQVAAA